MTIKIIYNVTKKYIFQIKSVLLNFLFIKESWKIKCISTKIFGSIAVFNIYINQNVSRAAYQYIGMISEGSCDTEDWSNDAEN